MTNRVARKNAREFERKYTRLKNVLSENRLKTCNILSTSKMERKIENVKWVEDYRTEQCKITQDILKGIDTTNPRIIPVLYSYKRDSVQSHEDEVRKVLNNFREMMDNPKREVARIEKLFPLRRSRKSLLLSKKSFHGRYQV